MPDTSSTPSGRPTAPPRRDNPHHQPHAAPSSRRTRSQPPRADRPAHHVQPSGPHQGEQGGQQQHRRANATGGQQGREAGGQEEHTAARPQQSQPAAAGRRAPDSPTEAELPSARVPVVQAGPGGGETVPAEADAVEQPELPHRPGQPQEDRASPVATPAFVLPEASCGPGRRCAGSGSMPFRCSMEKKPGMVRHSPSRAAQASVSRQDWPVYPKMRSSGCSSTSFSPRSPAACRVSRSWHRSCSCSSAELRAASIQGSGCRCWQPFCTPRRPVHAFR